MKGARGEILEQLGPGHCGGRRTGYSGRRGARRTVHVSLPAAAEAVSVPKAPGDPKGLVLPPGNALGPAPGLHGPVPGVGPAGPRFLMAFKMGEALATPKRFEDRDGMAFPNPEP